ncbi:DUF4105 domain-containing protein [Anaerorudis cellulosivorans]|uniref:DUF4105 domain-containing protein n=1 Tax=Anaerorudis cellulosivorans TaxID=3397862 RepID=UPI00221EF6DC|nr:DUF4105 domain-containing protein [Seramator thermalis]MCW1734882.1 DUF4105 domain-containing protein [Seramator thermalis]
MKRSFFAVLWLLISLIPSKAQIQLGDSAKISLMTSEPWPGAVYALFGHTALWVHDDSTGVDAAFNYGYFDPSQPYFIYHFLRGETDYILGVTSYEDFISEYRQKGVNVYEQELNLTREELQNLWQALYINSLPENRKYRYNYLYDNCATRPRDMVEKYVQGKIIYPQDNNEQTFRDLIHECVHPYPWLEFGIDLLVGNEADRRADVREKMFLPMYLMKAFKDAMVVKNDTLRYPLLKNTQLVLSGNTAVLQQQNDKAGFTPLPAALLLLLVTFLISVVQLVKLNNPKFSTIYDTFLFGIAGIGGAVIFFLLFFSEHPATNPNWNFAWLNIFAFVFAILFWVRPAKKMVYVYHFINFVALTAFLLLWWLIPQQLPLATIPFSMSLWLRSGTNVWISIKRRSKNKRYASFKYMKAGWGE